MKVRELIRLLKKQNQDADVCWQAHDQSEHECDGWVFNVSAAEQSLLVAEGRDHVVVLRP